MSRAALLGSTPDVATPDVATPDVASPDVAMPDVASPDVASPDVATPDVASPVPVPQPRRRANAAFGTHAVVARSQLALAAVYGADRDTLAEVAHSGGAAALRTVRVGVRKAQAGTSELTGMILAGMIPAGMGVAGTLPVGMIRVGMRLVGMGLAGTRSAGMRPRGMRSVGVGPRRGRRRRGGA